MLFLKVAVVLFFESLRFRFGSGATRGVDLGRCWQSTSWQSPELRDLPAAHGQRRSSDLSHLKKQHPALQTENDLFVFFS